MAKKTLKITKFFILLFFSFSAKQIRQVCQNSKKIRIVIDTGLGETVIGSNSMMFNLTIPGGIVLKLESSPKFQKRLLLQAVLRRSWGGGREEGRQGKRERRERGWHLRMRFS
jgi:hypothetical protein